MGEKIKEQTKNGYHLLDENFDKLLLTFLIVFFTVVAIRADKLGSTITAAMLDNDKTIVGALIGLVTGIKIGMSIANKANNTPAPSLPGGNDAPKP